MGPTEKFEVTVDHWMCCHHIRRTNFCADCGRVRPARQFSSRITDILSGWEQEQHVFEKTAQTFSDKAVLATIGIERISAAKDFDELSVILKECGLTGAQSHPWDTDDDFEQGRDEVSREASHIHSIHIGQSETNLRKASIRAYWIKTVRELLEMIPGGAA